METDRPLFHLLHYFKVFPCTGCTEPTQCFYYHDGDDRRTTTKKIARRCKFGAECSRDDCKFSHNKFQMSCHYAKFKRKPCRQGETCQNMLCTHWHCPEERDFYAHVNQFLFQKTCEINPFDFFDPNRESVKGFRYYPIAEPDSFDPNSSFSSQTTFRVRQLSTSRTHFDEDSRPDFIYHLEIPIDEDHFHEFKCYNLENLDTFVYPRLAENICSFYNSDGGKLLLGINDDGIVRGVPALDPQRLAFQKKIATFWREFQPALHETALQLNCYSVVDPNFGRRVPYVYVFELEIESRQDQTVDHLTPEGKFFQRLNASKQKNTNLVPSLVYSSPKSDSSTIRSTPNRTSTRRTSKETSSSEIVEKEELNQISSTVEGSSEEVQTEERAQKGGEDRDDHPDSDAKECIGERIIDTTIVGDENGKVVLTSARFSVTSADSSQGEQEVVVNPEIKNLEEVSSEEISVLIERKAADLLGVEVTSNSNGSSRGSCATSDIVSSDSHSQSSSGSTSTVETRSIQTDLSFLQEKHEKRLQKKLKKANYRRNSSNHSSAAIEPLVKVEVVTSFSQTVDGDGNKDFVAPIAHTGTTDAALVAARQEKSKKRQRSNDQKKAACCVVF